MNTNRVTRSATLVAFAAIACVSTALTGCGGKPPENKPLPPAVFVKPVVREVTEWDEYSGRLDSPRMVNLSSRVAGVIVQAPFREGALVQEGDVLYVIDDRPFKADLESKSAEIARAQSQVAQADARYRRYEKLQGTKAISADVFDEAVASLRQARANLGVAQAAYEVAKLNLEWTRVTAPIAGRISRKLVTEGNQVSGGAGQATPLTTIASVDPMHCYVQVPEREFLSYQAIADKKRAEGSEARIPCEIRLENEKEYTTNGFVDFVDNKVDPATGTIELRCAVPNPNDRLTAGLFARMRVPGTEPYRAILVPDTAVGTDQNGKVLTVLGPDDVVSSRPVKTGAAFGPLRVIKDGITESDRIVVTGLQQLRPGTKTAPVEATPAPEVGK